MAYRTRIKYTAAQKAEIWDRWQRGEPLTAIGRLFDRPSSSIFNMLVPTGGIRPPPRRRSSLALTLAEREEISRGLARDLPLRTIAARLKSIAMVACSTTVPAMLIRRPGIEHDGPSPVNWYVSRRLAGWWRASSGCTGHRSRSPVG